MEGGGGGGGERAESAEVWEMEGGCGRLRRWRWRRQESRSPYNLRTISDGARRAVRGRSSLMALSSGACLACGAL